MKIGVMNKSTILNRCVLHNLQHNITHLAIITRKTKLKLDILKGGNWKRARSDNVIRSFLVKNCRWMGKEKQILFTLFDFDEN